MMKYLILVSFYVDVLSLNAMELPPKKEPILETSQEKPKIPFGMTPFYDQEIKKFKTTYHSFDEPEKNFFSLLKNESSQRKQAYSNYLQNFLSKIIIQDLLINIIDEYSYGYILLQKNRIKLHEAIHDLHGKMIHNDPIHFSNVTYDIQAKTVDGTAALVSNVELFKGTITSEDLTKIIFPLKASTNKEVQAFGSFLEARYVDSLLPKQFGPLKQKYIVLVPALLSANLIKFESSALIKNNLQFYSRIIKQAIEHNEQANKLMSLGAGEVDPNSSISLEDKYIAELRKIADLYYILRPWYEKLYSELFQQLISVTGKQEFEIQYAPTKAQAQEYVTANLVPKFLPATLPTHIPADQKIKSYSFDKAFDTF